MRVRDERTAIVLKKTSEGGGGGGGKNLSCDKSASYKLCEY